jgi:hypothetical protein
MAPTNKALMRAATNKAQMGPVTNKDLICIDLSNLTSKISQNIVQCVGSRTDGMPTVDQSDMRGLVTA